MSLLTAPSVKKVKFSLEFTYQISNLGLSEKIGKVIKLKKY